jgi:GNAT superfamily N-acetyltransferase
VSYSSCQRVGVDPTSRVQEPELTMPHAFSFVTHAQREALPELIAIYQEAIDPSEQKTLAEFEAMVTDPRYVLSVSRADNEISGFSISFFPADADCWLLEYMAVAPSSRSRGLGDAIFHEAYRYGLRRAPHRTMVLEVDQPGLAVRAKNDTIGRLRFYRRMGCRKLEGLSYILPLDTAGTPPPMMLLTYAIPSLVTLDKPKVERWLTTIYRDAYDVPSHDPRLIKMVTHLSDTIVLLPL